jgi:hypothetical protein
MSSPSSNIVTQVSADTAGNETVLTLTPAGNSGIVTIGNGGAPQAGVNVNGNGSGGIVCATGSGSADLVVDGSAVECILDAKSALNVESKLTVQPGFLAAATNGGGAGEVSVTHQVGFVNTTNRNGSPNDNYTRGSNNRLSYFSGIGDFTDSGLPAAQGTVNCAVPFPTPPGATTAVVRLEIVLLVKCIVQGAAGPRYTPFVGDYFLQKFYTTWVNISGTFTVANANVGSSPIDSFTGVATLDTSGTTFINIMGSPNPAYKLNTDLVVTPSGSNLLVQATPGTYNDFGLQTVNVGTATVQIYVTAWYN